MGGGGGGRRAGGAHPRRARKGEGVKGLGRQRQGYCNDGWVLETSGWIGTNDDDAVPHSALSGYRGGWAVGEWYRPGAGKGGQEAWLPLVVVRTGGREGLIFRIMPLI